jgi:type I restriction enzyme S subunit
MAETLFRQWFVEEAKEDWEETISEIPIEIIDGDRGKNYPQSVDFFDEEYCLFLSAKNVTTDGFDFSQKQFITKEKDSQLRKGKLMRGDIILTTRGTVGNFSFYDDTISFDNIRINSGMIILRSKKYDPVLFYNIFKSDYFKKNLSEFISGSAQPQIPIRDFREIMIPFPTEVVINKYLKSIKPLYSKLFKCNKQILTLEKLRDTLLPKLMSGEVWVKM